MIERINPVLTGFDEAVLQRWGLKPTAKDTLTRAKERGIITPQEISEMISNSLAKDRQKMSEVLQEIKKLLQNLSIVVTFNVVHTHNIVHTSNSVTEPAPKVMSPKETPKTLVPQQPEKQDESPFLNARILSEHGLAPNTLNILLAAKTKGQITPQQVGSLIPAEISQDNEKLRSTMRWIVQLLSAIDIRIIIGTANIQKPKRIDSQTTRPSFDERLEDKTEPSDEAMRIAKCNIRNLDDEHGDQSEAFVPKFIFDRADGICNSYYRTAKDHKLLRHEDLLELSRRWHKFEDYAARNEIVIHNQRLAMKIAAHYMGRGLDYDDLVQEGNIGLIEAVKRFDPERGCHFSTYAIWWIRQSIQRALHNFRDLIRMPVHLHEKLTRILRITCELGMELQREPTLEEVAVRAEEDVDKVKRVLHQLKIPIVSLEELASGHENERTIGDNTPDISSLSPSIALQAKDDLEIASRNIRVLLASIKALPVSERVKTAFKMYYGLEGYSEGYTLESIAETSGFGVTRERIRQLNDQVWQKLAEYGISMNDEKLVAMLKRVHDLENIVCNEANLSTPTEDIILDEVSVIFQDDADQNSGEMVPGVIVTSILPKANLTEVNHSEAIQEQPIEQVVQPTEVVIQGFSPIIEQVLTLSCQVFGVERKHLFQKFVRSIEPEILSAKLARDVAMHLLHVDIGIQCSEVAKVFDFGCYSNVSVICGDIEHLSRTNADIRSKMDLIRSRYSLEPYGSDLGLLKKCQKRLFPKQVEELKAIAEKAQQSFRGRVSELHAKVDRIDIPQRHRDYFKARHSGNISTDIITYKSLGKPLGLTRARIEQIVNGVWEHLVLTRESIDIQSSGEYIQEFKRVRLLAELLRR